MSKESDEKRELLRLKQGLIEDSDIIEQDVHEEPEKQTAVKKIDNFFYRNKWFVVVGVFFAALIAFFAYQIFTREGPDLTVMLVISDTDKAPGLYQKVNDIELALEQYCPDYDNNGYVHVAVYFIDLTKGSDSQYVQSNTAKFYGEIQRGVAELYICDEDIFTTEKAPEEYDPSQDYIDTDVSYETMFADLGEALNMSEYSGKLRICLNDTEFVKDAKWENSCPDTLAFSVRLEKEGMISYKNSAEYQKRAKEVLTNILTGNKVNEAAENNSSEQGE